MRRDGIGDVADKVPAPSADRGPARRPAMTYRKGAAACLRRAAHQPMPAHKASTPA